jgi:uncharacterized protein (TIRG00374 family)
MPEERDLKLRRTLRRLIVWFIASLLLGLALRGVPLNEIADTLARFSLSQLVLLTLINTAIILSFAGRWWLILHALGYGLSYLKLAAYRLAAFAVSYFTPGPQFGGEPLQVSLVMRRENVPGETATASVTLDKALELLANFTFLAIGTVVILQFGVFATWLVMILRLLAIGLLLLPIALLYAAWRGKRPGTWLMARIPVRVRARLPGFERINAFICATETEVITFCQQNLLALVSGVLVSLITWMVLVGEYWLMMSFLGIQLDLLETIAVLTIARFAFLTPLPGGLGALEAGQMLALSSLGYSSAAGLSLALLIRGRDLFFGGLGLLLGSLFLARRPSTRDSLAEPDLRLDP